jgi:hypothetical protein
MPEIHIIRAGSYTDMHGRPFTLGEADVAALAGGYDPAQGEAPLVVGHPKHDAPAYGWVRGLRADGGDLYADVDQVAPAAQEAVNAGRFKKVSASFFLPQTPGNPKPGSLYLKHVGLLGASVPAVTGLKPVALAADAEGTVTVEFSAPSDLLVWPLRAMAQLFRGMRERLIATDGVEVADKTLPTYSIDTLTETAERLAQDAARDAVPAFASPTITETPMPGPASTPALEAREQELATREAALAARLAEVRATDDGAFIDRLVAEARLPQGLREEAVAFMATLDAEAPLAFAGQQRTARDEFRSLLERIPPAVKLGEEIATGEGGDEAADFAAPDGYAVDATGLETHRLALAYQKAHPGTAYIDAAIAVEKGARA